MADTMASKHVELSRKNSTKFWGEHGYISKCLLLLLWQRIGKRPVTVRCFADFGWLF